MVCNKKKRFSDLNIRLIFKKYNSILQAHYIKHTKEK